MAIARDSVDAVVARLRAVREQISGLNVDALTPVERLELLGELEVDRRSQPAAEHRLLQALVNQSTAGEMGGANWPHVLTERLRIQPSRGASAPGRGRRPRPAHRIDR